MRSRHALAFLVVCISFSLAASAAEKNKARTLADSRALGAMALGDSNKDLVFTPLTPCRIFDTRASGSPIPGTFSRSFIVAGDTGFDAQGGNAAGCGVPLTATAALINFIAVNPSGAGNLRGSAYPALPPATGSFINYQALTPNLNIANGIPFPICDHSAGPCPFDITILVNGAATHVVGDVFGFFERFPTEEIITEIKASTGLEGGGTSGTVSVGIAPGGVGTTELADSSVTPSKISPTGSTVGQVPMSTGSSVTWQTPPQGDITAVNAGSGLTGGALSGPATLSANFPASGPFSGTASNVARADHKHYLSTVIVSPVGSQAQNGTALSAALGGITITPALVKIEPGIYDLGNSQLFLRNGIDIEGSGVGVTTVRNANGAVMVGANCEVRSLTLEAFGDGNFSAGITTTTADTNIRLRDLSIFASDGATQTIGVRASTRINYELDNVQISVTGDGTVLGIFIDGPDGFNTFRDVSVVATTTSTTDAAAAMSVEGITRMERLRAVVTGAGSAYGIYSDNGLTYVVDSDLDVFATSGTAAGIWKIGASSIEVRNSKVIARGVVSYGIEDNTGTSNAITVQHSWIAGSTNTVFASPGPAVRIAGSRLAGGPVDAPGAICTFNWDENLTGNAAACF